ncbi:hypothetical protein BKA66DRAFT_442472 [Pyrenochaeta sp. MPI-SDFR-AT-0127]|nr:hypothetical protein BKA66DRAFT_442472 [Pyrenochaeta sp. MPI-SDFR-AT-0127]
MNGAFYQGAAYVPPGGTKKEKQRRQEQWDEYQRQHMTIAEDPQDRSDPSKPTSRRRADSLQPTTSLHSARGCESPDVRASNCSAVSPARFESTNNDYSSERLRRFSSAEQYNTSPLAQSNSHSETRRLSGNFNAPTHVELERCKDQKRGLRGMDKVKSTVRGWVKA